MSSILIPVAAIGGMGLLFGGGLGIASIKLKVDQDPKVPLVRDCLPGANCGGCGFAGCDALAEAIATGKAPVNACPVGGTACAVKIGKVMGIKAEQGAKKVA
ncbi:MAG: RnfABCDGE type electron transport complex subunit B, partial [Firmicutes bacterium]|nr:RnfABCDGE type electron transport complex subunit B [Bacillota bacterium]